jgi:hypothetical protein
MCNQTVGLIAAEIERRGIPTVCLALLREIAEKVRPPRTLAVPFPHGYPLGTAHDAVLQRDVLAQALALLEREEQPPVIADYGVRRR